jgi:hypothetical protein
LRGHVDALLRRVVPVRATRVAEGTILGEPEPVSDAPIARSRLGLFTYQAPDR